ncbi:MAG TPA: serine hydrolase [Gemmatimonadaceae bacterium]|nr:serine hydrolase [Gemmatimonadaceae bacterium]
MPTTHRSRFVAAIIHATFIALGTACATSTTERAAAATASGSATSATSAHYFPERGDAWQRRPPAALGLDSAKLDEAVRFAVASEITWSRDLHAQVAENTRNEPYPDILGPVKERGGPSGLVVRGGYIVAEWGDTHRVDMTFSVAKSYLSTMAGLALDRGLIRDVNDPVSRYVQDEHWKSERNSRITWHQLLTQTSEWEGTLWDKPDVADRRRGRDRALQEPGTFWEYNDVRVNVTALALLRVWKKPLPEVLRDEIMTPIDASNDWVWHGYRNSFVEIDGKRMQSVSGGGHWGGGVWASTRDHARFGYLMLRRGRWRDRQLISEGWIRMATTPTPIRPVYGYMWWLNTDRTQYRAATDSSFFALGAGGNIIWIVPEHDMVVVTRWLDGRQTNAFMERLLSAVITPPQRP